MAKRFPRAEAARAAARAALGEDVFKTLPNPVHLRSLMQRAAQTKSHTACQRIMHELNDQFKVLGGLMKLAGPLSDEISAAPLPNCPESCTTCASQYSPESWKTADWSKDHLWDDDATAETTAQGFVHNAGTDAAFVREKIEQYGDAILNRWRRRDSKKRAKLLLDAYPEIYRHRWVSASYIYNDTKRRIIRNDEGAEDVLHLPYIDLPSLSESPMPLLSLMHHRVHGEPSDWVLFDSEQMDVAFDLGNTRNNPHCVVMYGKYYGELIPWNVDSAHRCDIMGYPRARLILESQRLLFRFLKTMVELIMGHDVTHAVKGRSMWDAAASQGFQQSTRIASDATCVPRAFPPSPVFDAAELLQVLDARRNCVQDELWLLQTDPAYFRRLLQQFTNSALVDSLSTEKVQLHLIHAILGNFTRLHSWDFHRYAAKVL